MEELKVINQQEVLGKEFKVYGTLEQPLFLAKDVAVWIEHSNATEMIRGLDDDEKLNSTILSSGQNREMAFVTEDGLYEILMLSRKPIAKEFKKQVKAILKQIRLTGGAVYKDREDEFISNYFPSFSDDVKLAMVQDLKKQNTEYKNKIEQQKPLVEFAETVSNAVNSISIGDFAKILHGENIKLGRNKMFDWFRDNKYLMKGNIPYQKYIDCGYFEVIEQSYKTPYGDNVTTKTLLTGKGQIYFVETLRKKYSK